MLIENSPLHGLTDALVGRLHTLLDTRSVVEKRQGMTDQLTPHFAALMSSRDMLDAEIEKVRGVLEYATWYQETAEALAREVVDFETLADTTTTPGEARLLAGEVRRIEALAIKTVSEFLAGA